MRAGRGGTRLPQELRERGIGQAEAANGFLRQECREEFNRRFAVAVAEKETAFVRTAQGSGVGIFDPTRTAPPAPNRH
jgi:hypothetical protein